MMTGKIVISEGKSRRTKKWKEVWLTLEELVSRFRSTTYTDETVEEYKKLPKNVQGDIKDVGGYVGGRLKDGVRSATTVVSRSLIVLDIDYVGKDTLDKIKAEYKFMWFIHSTHKHTPESPRLRLVVPLTMEITPEEYEAVGRALASKISMDVFDDSTFEPSRLMYWPSTSNDGEYFFLENSGEVLNPCEVLAEYKDWRDVSSWPVSSRVNQGNISKSGKAKNPREKGGIIGAFSVAYPIENAIDTFLSDKYSQCNMDGRYTYVNGTSYGGLVIYENGDFAYSFHSTDPAGGRLVNSFDLVRIHLFGDLDKNITDTVKVSKLPSYKAMIDFAINDEKIKIILGKEKIRSAKNDFTVVNQGEAVDLEWLSMLELDKHGNYKNTRNNIMIILTHDQNIRGAIWYNEFSYSIMARRDLPWKIIENKVDGDPWRNCDDSGLREYLETTYGITSVSKVEDAFTLIANQNTYHPIRDYVQGIKWDGVSRIEKIFIDYLGADDNEYTRQVTKKSLVAAVARIMEPGVKFDYMIVLVGKQGIGKSQIIKSLGGKWYSDSLNTLVGKEAYEQLKEAWILEMAELSATKRIEVETVKHFISKTVDIYRVAYGKRAERFPRQCIFMGTTNEWDFLKDSSGNRRYWPIIVGKNEIKKSIWDDLTEYDIDQIWGEAMHFWNDGEKLCLDSKVEDDAKAIQATHTEYNGKEGLIREYLDKELPENWSALDIHTRRRHIHGSEFGSAVQGTIVRNKVCVMEIWMELFNGDPKLLTPMQSREINEILRNIKGWLPLEKPARFSKLYGVQRGYYRV